MKLLLYWHTVRHLKPVQIFGRIRFKLVRPRVRTGLPPQRRLRNGSWVQPVPRVRSWFPPDQFSFIGKTHRLLPGQWNNAGRDALWIYNLHYFDDLLADDNATRTSDHASLVSRWISENPPANGRGWDPYPVSLRLCNWIKWCMATNAAPPGFDASLASQTCWLYGRIEHHLLANHLFVNAKALIFSGLYFQGAEAELWRGEGLRILDREIEEQILDDGGHFERSPMYHALLLEDLLDLINVASAWSGGIAHTVVQRWRAIVPRMLEWLAAMSHPDGEPALFNDCAIGIAPNLDQLMAYAQRLGIACEVDLGVSQCRFLTSSGYVRAEHGEAVLIADVGEIGPTYQPAHAHADTFSFELSIAGRRIIVDPGTSTYETGSQRAFERSTAAHNTVVIDGSNSSEVWGAFRVARRAIPFGVEVEFQPHRTMIAASHDGYVRLSGEPIHSRSIELSARTLKIVDRVERGAGRSIAYFRFHPGVKVLEDGSACIGDKINMSWCVRGSRVRISAGTWHPRFGESQACQVIEATIDGDEAMFELKW